MLKFFLKTAPILFYSLVVASALGLGGCGGKLATPGCASISHICPNGHMLLHYPDGKCEWKRVRSEDVCLEIPKLAKNLNKPGRVIETKKGSTITFPCGDTFVYQDVPKLNGDCPTK